MILRCLHLLFGSLRQNLHHQHMYSFVPLVNRGDTPERGWLHSESCHTVCLIFGRVGNKKNQIFWWTLIMINCYIIRKKQYVKDITRN